MGESHNQALHRYCDTSLKGYGTCLYAQSINSKGICLVNSICAKSRISPLKNVIIPRLELCAAVSLPDLYVKVAYSFPFKINRVVFWSDSTIVLQWLQSNPAVLKTFVTNRVERVQRLGKLVQWHHVRS